MAEFKVNIKNIRIQRKLTQKQMAQLIDVTERTYQNYEAGTSEPNMATIEKIVKAFDVSSDYLIGLSENPKI